MKLLIAAALAVPLAACAPMVTQSPAHGLSPVNAIADGEDEHLMLFGYDVVAYFADKHPEKGLPTIKSVYKDVTFRFANAGHKALFDKSPEKILHHRDTYLGFCGSAAHQLVFESLLASHTDLDFAGKTAVFETFRKLHPILKEQHFLNPKEEEDDPYESTQITALIANKYGIFGIYSMREVFEYNRFWAAGSGREFALGAAARHGAEDPRLQRRRARPLRLHPRHLRRRHRRRRRGGALRGRSGRLRGAGALAGGDRQPRRRRCRRPWSRPASQPAAGQRRWGRGRRCPRRGGAGGTGRGGGGAATRGQRLKPRPDAGRMPTGAPGRGRQPLRKGVKEPSRAVRGCAEKRSRPRVRRASPVRDRVAQQVRSRLFSVVTAPRTRCCPCPGAAAR